MGRGNQHQQGRGGRGGSGRGRSGGGRGRGRGRGRGGRGRGSGGRNNSHHANSQSAAHGGINNTSNKSNSNKVFKRAGEKGAEAHTVSEDIRIQFTNILLQFRENEDPTLDKYEMPPDLSNTERKFLHMLSMQLGLKSKSTGKGDKRRIIITKRSEEKIVAGSVHNNNSSNNGDGDNVLDNGDDHLPTLDIGRQAADALRKYIRQYPPNDIELTEAQETGSSLWRKKEKTNGNGNADGNGENAPMMELQENDTTEPQPENNTKLIQTLEELNLTMTDDNSGKAHQHYQTRRRSKQPPNLQRRRMLHDQVQHNKLHHPNYDTMQKMRSKLPAYQHQTQIVHMIQNNHVTILSGDTGCGKSTQVPQFILDSSTMGPTCNIIVTQPRRLSAMSIAERVAAERCEDVGDAIGYNVRLESSTSERTQLTFVTPGILLRKLQSSPSLLEYTHVIIDEVHERDKYTEFLMIALKELMKKRRRSSTSTSALHIVLMSATIQTNELMTYWSGIGSSGGSSGGDETKLDSDMDTGMDTDMNMDTNNIDNDYMPAEICVPGRTFPVQSFYLEDVLSITGTVNDEQYGFGGGGGGMMDDLEADLLALLNQNTNTNADMVKKGKKRKAKNNQGGPGPGPGPGPGQEPTIIVSENSLVCVMCNQGGFKCPEELGAHMGLCTGVVSGGVGGAIDMVALEQKVRDTNVCTTLTNASAATTGNEKDDVFEDYDENDAVGDEYNDINDDVDDDDDDDMNGLHHGKWDGESPFAVADIMNSSSKSTLTVEEMLNRYQMMHDDETVDNDLIVDVIKYIDMSSYGDGAILVFLPGWQEISELSLLLDSTPPMNNRNKFSVLPLHSGIPSKEQRLVFQRPRGGVRKIILSTNIAETSITIDDVAFVIDSGRAKEKNYDPHIKTSTLQPVWISQASAKQRRGRAGRTKPGVCFHLFSRRRHASFREFLESELLRTSLEEICLQCKKLNLTPGGPEDNDGIPAFLAAALTPPHPKSVSNALEMLVNLGAMDDDTNELTRLGHCLSCLSVEPRVGKMIIWSYILGCSKDVTAMAVAMGYKSPFIIPPPSMRRDADYAKVKLSDGTESDQVTILNVLKARDSYYRRGEKNRFYSFCRNNYVNSSTIQMVSDLRRNIARELSTIGYPNPTAPNTWYNRNGDGSLATLQSAIVAGVYPNVACRQAGAINFSTATNRKSKIHISSVNACKGQPLSKKSQMLEFIAYGEMVKGVAMYTMNMTTHLASALPILLLCGEFRIRPAVIIGETVEGVMGMSVLNVDDWIVFKCDTDIASSLAVLRKRLDIIFHRIVSNPSQGYDRLSQLDKNTLDTLDCITKGAFLASPGRA